MKDIMISEEDEEDYRKNIYCRLCEKEIIIDKVIDHCDLTGKHRGSAHESCELNVTQRQTKFIPSKFHNFSIYDYHLFFKTLVDKKKDEVKFDVIDKTNEEYRTLSYGCIRLIDSHRLL